MIDLKNFFHTPFFQVLIVIIIIFITSMDLTIVIKFFIRMIFFDSSLFNTSRCINNTLFIWYITDDSRSFTVFHCIFVTPRTLCCTNNKNLLCDSTCSKTKNLGARSEYVWCHKWLLPYLMYFLFQINSSPSNEPFLFSKIVYSVQNMSWVTAISSGDNSWNNIWLHCWLFSYNHCSNYLLHIWECG